MRLKFKLILSIAALCALAGCGGGGGGGTVAAVGATNTTSTAPPNITTTTPATTTTSPPAASVTVPTPPPYVGSGLSVVLQDGSTPSSINTLAGEKIAKNIVLQKALPTINADISIVGSSVLTLRQLSTVSYALDIDARNLNPDVSLTSIVTARNRENGQSTQLTLTVSVLQPKLLAKGTLGTQAGVVASADSDIGLAISAGQLTTPVGVTITGATTSLGERLVRMQFSRDMSRETAKVKLLRNPRTNNLAVTTQTSQKSALLNYKTIGTNDPIITPLISTIAYFTEWGLHRLASDTQSFQDLSRTCEYGQGGTAQVNNVCLRLTDASTLFSQKTKSTIDAEVRDGKNVVPVVFIHGFAQGGEQAGGSETWGTFPSYINSFSSATQSFALYEFSWRTGASFKVVANDLATALQRIHTETSGKKVRIVAHSFGGLLTRTLLQGLASENSNFDGLRYVESVLTLGTPHSGIFDSDSISMPALGSTTNAILGQATLFPNGQDSREGMFEACEQVSCHEAGEHVDVYNDAALLAGMNQNTPGQVVNQLANTRLPAGLPFVVGIGLKRKDDRNSIYDEGDGLITFKGQRFNPTLSFTTTQAVSSQNLLACSTRFGGRVMEVIVSDIANTATSSVRPGSTVLNNVRGYSHSGGGGLSSATSTAPDSEIEYGVAFLSCTPGNACDHGAYNLFNAMLQKPQDYCGVAPVSAPAQGLTVSFTVVSLGVNGAVQPIANASLNIGVSQTAASVAVAVTNAQGAAQIFVPGAVAGRTITVQVTADNYLGLPGEAYLIPASTTGIVTFPQIQLTTSGGVRGYGIAGFTVKNGLNGVALGGVNWQLVRSGSVYRQGVSPANGVVEILELSAGTYQLILSANGFSSSIYTVSAFPNQSNLWGGTTVIPVLLTGKATIRLTWGENPSDLDSHLFRYNSSAQLMSHIYYPLAARVDTATGNLLDLDDQTSYGPETTTIQSIDPSSVYVYAVHLYRGSGSLTGTSNARVDLSIGGGGATQFNVPTNGIGTESWWKVFEIIRGQVVPCTTNCLLTGDPFKVVGASRYQKPTQTQPPSTPE